jgi:DNA-damage-inducible protein J
MSNKINNMTQIQIRIDVDTKEKARKVLDNIGLDISAAVKTFLRQVVMMGGLPYELRDLNGYTKQEIEEIKASYNDAIKHGKRFNSVDDAIKSLNV